jgi:hypothetical protein
MKTARLNAWLTTATAILIVACLGLGTGCSHPLTVKNLGKYDVSRATAMTTPKTIGVVADQSNIHDDRIADGIIDNLRRYAREVVAPYHNRSQVDVDVVAKIDIDSEYLGSGQNFWIDFPGFLVWYPAMNGYVYTINHDFNIRLEDGATQGELKSFTVPVNLDIRHAAMNRTWLAESGWWAPGWGITAALGGLIHMDYDRNVTPLAAEKVAQPIGDYVAQEIVKRICARDMARASLASGNTGGSE